MKIKKYLIVAFAMIILVISYRGPRDINKRDICLCILLSRNNKQDSFKFIAEIASLSNKSIGEEFEYIDTYTVAGEGSTFEKGRLDYESKISNPLFLGSVKTVIFDQTQAEYGILSYLNRIKGLTEYKKTLIPCVSMNEFSDLLNKDLIKGSSIGFNTEAILKYQDLIGSGVVLTAGELFALKSDTDVGYVLPLIKIEENALQFYGQGIFKNSKMIDSLKLSECNGINYILNENFKLSKSFKYDRDPENYYSVEISKDKLNIKTAFIDSIPHIYVDLKLKGKYKFQYYDYNLKRKNLKELESSISDQVTREIESIMYRAQNIYECDIFNMKKYFRIYNYDQLRNQEWPNLFKKAQVHIEVETKFTDVNLTDMY